MISTAEALENALAPATEPPKAATKVRGRQTCAHCRAEEGEGGEEGHPRQEGAQKARRKLDLLRGGLREHTLPSIK